MPKPLDQQSPTIGPWATHGLRENFGGPQGFCRKSTDVYHPMLSPVLFSMRIDSQYYQRALIRNASSVVLAPLNSEGGVGSSAKKGRWRKRELRMAAPITDREGSMELGHLAGLGGEIQWWVCVRQQCDAEGGEHCVYKACKIHVSGPRDFKKFSLVVCEVRKVGNHCF